MNKKFIKIKDQAIIKYKIIFYTFLTLQSNKIESNKADKANDFKKATI